MQLYFQFVLFWSAEVSLYTSDVTCLCVDMTFSSACSTKTNHAVIRCCVQTVLVDFTFLTLYNAHPAALPLLLHLVPAHCL